MRRRLFLRRFRQSIVAATLAYVLLVMGQGYYPPDAFEQAVIPYRYSLARWEANNFMDKWLRRAGDLWPGGSRLSRERRLAQAREYFALARQEQELTRQAIFPQLAAPAAPAPVSMGQLREHRTRLQPEVEETLEAHVSAVLAEQGFAGWGGFIFPPVDAVYTTPPAVLITSPRDRIERSKTLLLRPELDDLKRAKIEAEVEAATGHAALVESIGGVALYPSVVSDHHGLAFGLETTAHEWLHQYFFFRPLGRRMWDSPEMNSLNETAATLGGQLLGDLAYTRLTGEKVERDLTQLPPPPGSGGFNFNGFMRETRLRTDELLAAGRVEEAEAYMEERRQELVAQGHLIRKLNQAYFAFHGTYATGAASSSPIGEQMRELLRRSASSGDFIRTAAQFGSYQEFLDYLGRPAAPAQAE